MKGMLVFVQAVFLALLLADAAVAAEEPKSPEVRAQGGPRHNIAPVWREARSGEPQFTTIKGVETNVLIQSGGETWREIRNGPISLYGGILLGLVVAGIGAFYAVRGPLKLEEAPTGRMIERFNGAERLVHWVMAGSFVVLALSGLTLLFGKHVLLPLFGYELFSWVAVTCKNLHNFVGPLFLLSIVAAFFQFAKDNLWRPEDGEWIRKAGGLVSGEHVPSGRFNFGEKSWFWLGVVLLGLSMSITGLILDFPNFEQGRGVMQVSHIIHATGAILFICLSLGHIYMGTIGVDGALDSMVHGQVDETWAKEHHELWYDEAKRPAAEPAPAAQPGAATAHS